MDEMKYSHGLDIRCCKYNCTLSFLKLYHLSTGPSRATPSSVEKIF